MTQQPEALRLADMFEAGNCGYPSRAAAELRRLHEVNQELLDALKSADWYIGQLEPFVYGPDDNGIHEEHAKVLAAIARAESTCKAQGETK